MKTLVSTPGCITVLYEEGLRGVGRAGECSALWRILGHYKLPEAWITETKKEYKLTVRVRDSSAPFFADTAEVTIAVQGLQTITPRNQDFKFSIFEGDPEGQFRIDPDLGNLYVHRKLDRETQEIYLLTVRATNTATPPLYGHASVKITLHDVNDNGPTFHPSEFHFSVKENTATHQSIGRISVDDPDVDPNGAPFFFEIANGNEEGHFKLDNRTGEILYKS
ncbi:Protocadherin Fat 4 [Desmophyllum pertusum]|uniref:Protocadherin Fat 4 n=1 Tax=Desmophyllum pertusum TaxID=174260 RepID=A0A9W9ZS33_9CNID|nr:Protocadherin Fat 4 [Desmophyllum pertusum]